MAADKQQLYQTYQERIISARRNQSSLLICGGNTKSFYGRKISGDYLDTTACNGIIAYEPTELVITAYAGTPISEIIKVLESQGQMLAFEPPAFGYAATLGGVVASGLSGPRRPYSGAVRDYVLGLKCINGRGEIMTFGGQVMKNVAGYDVSRLMAGAMGTLGLMLEISLKVLPKPEYELTLVRRTDFETALVTMHEYATQPLPLSAACYDGDSLYVRLSGKRVVVEHTRDQLGLDEYPEPEYWCNLNEQQLDYFRSDETLLWRISVPSNTPPLPFHGKWFIDWGGSLRWCKTNEDAQKIRNHVEAVGGHATIFRNDVVDDVFHPLPDSIKQIHTRLKYAFDPDKVINPGKMYQDI